MRELFTNNYLSHLASFLKRKDGVVDTMLRECTSEKLKRKIYNAKIFQRHKMPRF